MSEYVTYNIELPVKTIKSLNFIAKQYNCSVDGLISNLINKSYEELMEREEKNRHN